MKKTIITQGSKGGIGKTTIATCICDYYAQREVAAAIYDFDAENKANSGLQYFYPDAKKIDIRKRDGLDALLEAIENEDNQIIFADMGAGRGAETHEWFSSVAGELSDITELVTLAIVTPDPASVTAALEWAKALQNKCKYVVVKNEQETENADFSYWEKNATAFRKAAKPEELLFRSINPELQTALRTTGETLAQVASGTAPQTKGLRWKVRAQAILKPFFEQIEKTSLLNP